MTFEIVNDLYPPIIVWYLLQENSIRTLIRKLLIEWPEKRGSIKSRTFPSQSSLHKPFADAWIVEKGLHSDTVFHVRAIFLVGDDMSWNDKGAYRSHHSICFGRTVAGPPSDV